MKVLIVTNMAPFVRGGAELLAEHLCTQLRQTPGVSAEVLRVPFQWEPFERIPDQMLLSLAMELTNVDRVIALKFPAYLIPHPSKTLWLVHQYRQAYDLRDGGQSNLPATTARRGGPVADRRGRQCLLHRVPEALRGLRCRAGPPPEVQWLRRGRSARAPLNSPGALPTMSSSGDYVFAGGRVNLAKRQHLLVEAMAHVRSKAKLVVAGPPDAEEDGCA